MAAHPNFDEDLIVDVLGGDLLMTPAEAAAALRVDVLELAEMDITAVRVAGTVRYRTSVITALANAR